MSDLVKSVSPALNRILRYAAWPALRRHLSVRDRPEIAQPVVQDEVDRQFVVLLQQGIEPAAEI
jgi:hypothetical protein